MEKCEKRWKDYSPFKKIISVSLTIATMLGIASIGSSLGYLIRKDIEKYQGMKTKLEVVYEDSELSMLEYTVLMEKIKEIDIPSELKEAIIKYATKDGKIDDLEVKLIKEIYKNK